MHRYERLVPPGFSFIRELKFCAAITGWGGCLLVLGFLVNYLSARSDMFERVDGMRVEIPGAIMSGCAPMLNFGRIVFVLVAVVCLGLICRYVSYHYRGGSRCIYTMRRLRRRLEPVVRCCTIPVLGLLACQLLWRGLALVLGAGYMRAVPAEYIPPGAWEELIHLLTH